MLVQRKVRYTGRVQGVGFRYTAQRLAGKLRVAGYVKNQTDGSVELVAEGEEVEVDALLERVAEQMSGYIDNADIVNQAPQGLKGFRIAM